MPIDENQNWLTGEEHAWEILTSLDPEEVCRRAKVAFNESAEYYILPLFNENMYISPIERRVWGDSKVTDLVLNEFAHYSKLSALWYLIQAHNIPLSGNLVSPREVNGGLIFTQGSHVLPLNRLVETYGNDIERFARRGVSLGGAQMNHGDTSIRIFPFPRIPVVLLFWKHNKEFPARTDILFDSTCSKHLPPDIVWSTAMMSILVML
ncbi:DUF3786 domain-containing protein [Chloroflexota bacterium]